MTTTEWETSTNVMPMLIFLGGNASDRKLRLFGCACCRRLWDLLPAEETVSWIAAIEEHPDGLFSDPHLHAAISASSRREHELAPDKAYWAAKNLGRSFYKLRAWDKRDDRRPPSRVPSDGK